MQECRQNFRRVTTSLMNWIECDIIKDRSLLQSPVSIFTILGSEIEAKTRKRETVDKRREKYIRIPHLPTRDDIDLLIVLPM